MRELSGVAGKAVLAEADLVNLFYTFGTSHPGAIVLQNFPSSCRSSSDRTAATPTLRPPTSSRTRELGVPRYNEFRRLLHLKPANDFADLTDDPAMQKALGSSTATLTT